MRASLTKAKSAVHALALAVLSLAALAPSAQAATEAEPAWKLLAISSPTNLPPKQSEVQQLAVEAQGGSFKLSRKAGTGSGTPVVGTAVLRIESGNTTATIIGGALEVGARLTATSGTSIPAEATVVSCSPDCTTAGSTAVLSKAPTETKTVQTVKVFTKKLSSVSGNFHVGDVISGKGIAADTVVTEVGAGTLTVTKATTSAYSTGVIALTITEPTEPVPFNASATQLQSALDAMPAFTPGELTVSGGPAGDIDHPFFIAFGGSLADQDVEQLGVDSSGLTGEGATALISTTLPGGPGTGILSAFPANNGGKASSGTITMTVGPLPAGIVTSEPAFGFEWSCPGSAAGQSTVTCTTTRKINALGASPNPLEVPVEVQGSGPFTSSTHVELSGGGAAAPATYELPIVVSNQSAGFGLAAIWAGVYEADGSDATQAGGHPYSAASYFFANTARTRSGLLRPAADSRDVIADLQPGFVGNPKATKRCPQSETFPPDAGGSTLCNEEMSVGYLAPFVNGIEGGKEGGSGAGGFEKQRIYNNVPPKGYAAAFTTKLVSPLQTVLASVRSEDDYGVRLFAPNNATFAKVYGAFAAFEGVPKEGTGQALITNSTNCAEQAREPAVFRLKADTWQNPGKWFSAPDVPVPPVTGCEKLDLDPSFSFQPTSTRGSSAVGATAHLHIPNAGLTDPDKLAAPELKRAVVKLPEGFDLNPASANGIDGCSEAQIGYRGDGFPLPNPLRFDESAPRCPDGSKLGTVEVRTPLLDNPLTGTVFLATPRQNPFGALIAIYLVVDDARTGVRIKLPGEVRLDPGTGRLSTVFDYNPQLPFEDLTLRFRGGGPRSELSTPEVCGAHTTHGEWTPWSAPESGGPAQTSNSFDVSGNCAPSSAARPFNPSFEAGSTNLVAGGYSPMVIKIKRNDGEQELNRIEFTMPPGFTGRLAGISYCSEAQIAAARARSGREEQASPSCPAGSHVGSIDAAAGVGPQPYHVGGELYLAGPYRGAPLSAVAITPAVAGPFDLGNVVIRSPLYVDENSAQITAVSDPIPTILEGIPLKVREVSISIDRPDFTLNPTSCEAMAVTASLGSSDGATATPRNRFQVGGCEKLSFAPKTYFRLFGGVGRGAHPKVRAIYMAGRPGEANLLKGAFTIPRSEFLDQAHIRTICTRVQFAAKACPKGAVYGHVKAFSPIVDYPVSGPVYLRSSDHELPDLVFDLHGPAYQPVHVVVVLRIDSIKGQIRATVEGAPDLPVSKLIFVQKGGKKGLLINSRNICKRRYRATVKTVGHNGKRASFRPVLSNSRCGKQQRRAKRSGHRLRHRGRR